MGCVGDGPKRKTADEVLERGVSVTVTRGKKEKEKEKSKIKERKKKLRRGKFNNLVKFYKNG